MLVTQNRSVVTLNRSAEALTDMPIHSLSGLKQAHNYMYFRAFSTSIYSIRLSFIKIESKTGREEVRTKSAKKTGSWPRQSGSPRRSRRESKYDLGFA